MEAAIDTYVQYYYDAIVATQAADGTRRGLARLVSILRYRVTVRRVTTQDPSIVLGPGYLLKIDGKWRESRTRDAKWGSPYLSIQKTL